MRASSAALCLLGCLFLTLPAAHYARLLGKKSADSRRNLEEQSLPPGRGFWIEQLSVEPRAYLLHNFMSLEECEYLISQGKPHMEKSSVVDSETGKSKLDQVRTSSGTFLTRSQDEVIRRIEDRIALHSMIPVENGEGLQILRYNHGEKYASHNDYFHDSVNTVNGGQRIATMLMYLSNVEEGGETVFPDSPEKPNVGSADFSACGQAGVAVKPQAGDALLFYSQHPDNSLDPLSLHGGCPVIRGSKWSATKWMRVQPYKV